MTAPRVTDYAVGCTADSGPLASNDAWQDDFVKDLARDLRDARAALKAAEATLVRVRHVAAEYRAATMHGVANHIERTLGVECSTRDSGHSSWDDGMTLPPKPKRAKAAL